jgi:Zn-dependent peptidase ImmA (M78 family)
MSTTINESSVLYRLRQLAPKRPLTQFEAYRIAELQANQLLKWSNIDEPGTPDSVVTELPFVRVIVRPNLPVSGLANWSKPHWLIVLNADEPLVRRRYSLFHELKHAIDHEGISYLYADNATHNASERGELVADYFAACVLMPKRLVKRRFGEGMREVGELAAEFGVSVAAMRYRLHQLRVIDRPERRPHGYQLPPDVRSYFRRAWTTEAIAVYGAAS